MTRRFLIPALAAFLAAPLSAQAYNYTRTCNGQPARWEAGNPSTVWQISTNFPSSDMSASASKAAFQASFAEWSQPGCSAFTASQGADTTSDPRASDNKNVIGFLGSGEWPSSYGSSTLAVTSTSTYSDCTIAEADMVINEKDWSWVTGNPVNWSQADLQSVITHEAGHWLGLDHSTHNGASLNATYSGGTAERTLSCDDTEGVCGSHPSGGNACTSDIYCPCGVGCNDGYCGGEPSDPDPVPDPNTGLACDGDPTSVFENEPNDWVQEEDIDWLQPSENGDLLISGTVDCGNDGQDYIGDQDWFVIDFPCDDSARFVLDWSASADLDFYVWNESSDTPFAYSSDEGSVGPVQASGEIASRIYARVACWSGVETDYVLAIDFPPYDDISDHDGSTDTDDPSTPGDTDDGDPLDGGDDLVDDERALGCGCRTAPGLGTTTSGMVWMGLLGVLIRRRSVRG